MNSPHRSRFPLSFYLVLFITLLLFFGMQALMPMLPLYVLHLGGTAADNGLVIWVFALASVLARPLAGSLADRWGDWPVLGVGALLFGGAPLLYSLCPDLVTLLAARAVHGAGMALYTTAYRAMAAELSPSPRQGEGLGMVGTASSLTMAVAPLAGEWVVGDWGFPALFKLIGGLGIGAFGLSLAMPRVRRRVVTDGPGTMREALLRRDVRRGAVAMALLGLPYGALVGFLPLLAQARGLGPTGWVYAVYAVMVVVSGPACGSLSDRWGRLRVMVPGGALVALAAAGLALAGSWWAMVGLVALFGLGWGALRTSLDALVQDSAGSALRASATAAQYTAFDLGIGMGSLGLGALASAITWGVRPQMFNILLATAFTLIFHLYKVRGRNLLWLYPLLTALWVNLHSGFFLGLVLLGCFIAGEGAQRLLGCVHERTLTWRQMRNLALALGASVLAALLNPNTYEMLIYPFETLGSRAMQTYIQEWASPNFHQTQYWPFALLLLGTAAAMALSQRPVDLTDLLLFGSFGLAGLVSARHIPLFAVVATPVLTRHLVKGPAGKFLSRFQLSTPSRSGGLAVLNWALLLVIGMGCALRCAQVIGNNPRALREFYPMAALDYVEKSGLGQTRMYNSYNWGGYLLWRGYEVFIDGRADVYGDDFINEYLLAYRVRSDWRKPLDKYGADYVLIESRASFATLLEESLDWEQVYRDEVAVIFVRSNVE